MEDLNDKWTPALLKKAARESSRTRRTMVGLETTPPAALAGAPTPAAGINVPAAGVAPVQALAPVVAAEVCTALAPALTAGRGAAAEEEAQACAAEKEAQGRAAEEEARERAAWEQAEVWAAEEEEEARAAEEEARAREEASRERDIAAAARARARSNTLAARERVARGTQGEEGDGYKGEEGGSKTAINTANVEGRRTSTRRPPADIPAADNLLVPAKKPRRNGNAV